MTQTYKQLQIIILKSEGKKYVQCRCPDPNHVKGNDNSDITVERVLRALGKGMFIYTVDSQGQFAGYAGPIDLTWQLCKPAHEQSEETLLKLIEILS